MRHISLTLDYLPIEKIIGFIEKPQRKICRRILEDNRHLFEKARGSTHNHQAWEGGYVDHITDGMNLINNLYRFMKSFGRPLPFSLSDALLVFFIHDLEKPWRIVVDEKGVVSNRMGMETKEDFRIFREQQLLVYGLTLTPEQQNAFTYVESEGKDYSSTHRVMNELAAFCHIIDTWCARGWYDYPKAEGDEWTGARRFRTL